jgi:SAM-dependent methyltransferase
MVKNHGFCYSCNRRTVFRAKGDWWRDDYVCENCLSIPRERAIMYCIEKFFPNWKNLKIHETSPSNRGTSTRLMMEATQYISSQYFKRVPSGSTHNGVLCEDLEDLSFADESIDLHVSQDVMEHIYNPSKAFKELARTLKPGGAHIFTVPLVNKNIPSTVCASLRSDGSVEHLLSEPEYHGNPISEEGSLVTMHWGFDITTFIFQSCGLFTEMVYIDSLEYGIRAEYIEVLITRKPLR